MKGIPVKDEQFETILGLLTGMQLAVVHLACVVAEQKGTPKEDMADSFIETAVRLSPEIRNLEHIQTVLRQIASGIRQAQR